MPDISKYVLEFIAGLGGGAVVVTIVLKFMKERIAKLIDQEIELITSKALVKYERDLEKTKMAYSKKIEEEWNALTTILRETQAIKIHLEKLLSAISNITSHPKPYSYVTREFSQNECLIVNSTKDKIDSLKNKYETECIFLNKKINESFEKFWPIVRKITSDCNQLKNCNTSCQNEFTSNYQDHITEAIKQANIILKQMQERIISITGE